MDWQARYYPLDVFDGIRVQVEALVASGDIRAVDVVRDELHAVGPPAVHAWAKGQSGLFVLLDPELQEAGAAIEANYPDLADHRGMHQSADAYVIALAQRHGGVVVSQETAAAEKRNAKHQHYIPDVCRELGLTCISLLGLFRRERWKW
jgi:hypothetical protein